MNFPSEEFNARQSSGWFKSLSSHIVAFETIYIYLFTWDLIGLVRGNKLIIPQDLLKFK